jgi:hypothetical protein
MTWIKITHISGSTHLNIDQVYKYEQTAAAEITFYYDDSITPTVYSFSTAVELTEFITKLKSILKVIDIDQLATQG